MSNLFTRRRLFALLLMLVAISTASAASQEPSLLNRFTFVAYIDVGLAIYFGFSPALRDAFLTSVYRPGRSSLTASVLCILLWPRFCWMAARLHDQRLAELQAIEQQATVQKDSKTDT